MSPQLRLLLYSRKISAILQQLSLRVSSEFYHLNTWAPASLGYNFLCLCRLKVSALFPFLRALLLNIISRQLSCYYAFFDPSIFDSVYQSLFLTWYTQSDADSHSDRYTNISYDSSLILWIFLYLDSCPPESYPSNGVLLRRVNILEQLRFFLSNPNTLAPIRLSQDKAKSIVLVADHLNQKLAFDYLFLPYEAQPFQQSLLNHIHTRYPQLKTIGYIHSALPCIPSEYTYRPGCPQYLLINGNYQIPVLTRYLGWPNDSIIPIKALRYNYLEANLAPSAHIYLPYEFTLTKAFSQALDQAISILIRSYPNDANLVIRNHPVRRSSVKHRHLVLNIQQSLSQYSQDSSSGQAVFRDCSANMQQLSSPLLVIGNSAVIFELLNLSHNVLHVATDPLLDPLSHDIWPQLAITQITPSLYLYRNESFSPLFSSPSISSSLYYSQILSSL